MQYQRDISVVVLIFQSNSNLMLRVYFCKRILFSRFEIHCKTVDCFCAILELKLSEFILELIILS